MFADKPGTYTDAPISLQLVGRRYEDEKLIEALEFLTEAAGLPKLAGAPVVGRNLEVEGVSEHKAVA